MKTERAFADGENVFPDGGFDLPSRFQPGDTGVKIVIPNRGMLEYGNVTKVHFTENKVMYDLEFPFLQNDKRGYTRIHNVDSAFVEDMHWEPPIVEGGGIDGRYEKNDRGRWELKPECR